MKQVYDKETGIFDRYCKGCVTDSIHHKHIDNQQKLIEFMDNEKNIEKVVEGSMEKRIELFKQAALRLQNTYENIDKQSNL